jgi:TP901 family phage tail tape measure protein
MASTAAVELILSLRDEITQQLKGVRSQLDDLDRAAGNTNKTTGGMFSALKGASGVAVGALATVGVALGGVGVSAVSAAADFEQSLSGIKAVSGATAEEMAGIQKLTLQLGADTRYSASEAALGIEELIKGGIPIADVMNGAAESMLNLAAAGGVDLTAAAEISANAMGIFNLAGEDMENVVNQIAGAANASSLSVTDFQYSMSAAGSVAAGVGQSFDDLAVAIAIMGENGLKGSDAGTSLKTMLMNLQPTTKAQRAMFEELGITTEGMNNQFLNADGTFKSMAEIAGVLQEKTAHLTDAERALALETMFGSDAIRAGNILVKEGAEGFDQMAASMGKVTAADVAATRLDNFKGAIEALRGSWETFQIVIGQQVLPILTVLVRDHLTPGLNAVMAFSQAVLGADDPIAALRGEIEKVLPGFNSVVDVLNTGLTTAITFVTQNWEVFKGALIGVAAALGGTVVLGTIAGVVAALGTILSPIGLIVTAAAGLGVAWQTNWGDIQGKTRTVLEWFQTTLYPWLTETMLPDFLTGVNEVKQGWEIAWPAIKTAVSAVYDFFHDVVWPWLRDTAFPWLIDTGLPALLTAYETVWAAIGTAVQVVYTFWSETIWPWLQHTAFPWLQDTALPALQTAFETAWSAIQSAVNLAYTFFHDTVWPWLQDTFWPKLKELVADVQLAWETAWPLIEKSLLDVYTWISTIAWPWFETNIIKLKTWVDDVRTGWDIAWPAIKKAVTDVWGADENSGIRGIIGTAKGLFEDLKTGIETVKTALETGWTTVENAVKGVVDRLTGYLSPFASLLSGIGNFFSGVFGGGGGGGPGGNILAAIGAAGYSVTQGFSAGHQGIDIGVPTGTAIKSALGGVVHATFFHKDYGLLVQLRNQVTGKITEYFGHLSETLVKVGQIIAPGQTIGRSGNTGRATTGPHLHYELYDPVTGQPINPLAFQGPRGGGPGGSVSSLGAAFIREWFEGAHGEILRTNPLLDAIFYGAPGRVRGGRTDEPYNRGHTAGRRILDGIRDAIQLIGPVDEWIWGAPGRGGLGDRMAQSAYIQGQAMGRRIVDGMRSEFSVIPVAAPTPWGTQDIIPPPVPNPWNTGAPGSDVTTNPSVVAYNLTIHTSAPYEPLIADFRTLEAQRRRG